MLQYRCVYFWLRLQSLYFHIMCSITATLWDVSVEAVEHLSRIPRKKNLPIHRRLLDTLNSLRDFYYCEGEGVNGGALDSDAYLVRRLSR